MSTATLAAHRTRSGRIAVLVGSLLAGTLGIAQAQPPAQETPSVVVKYGDLDLSTSAGARTLYQRISAAARMVCPYENARELGLKAKGRECREAAIARAVSSVHNTELALIQAQHANRG
jgi:UrcA family protein